MFISFRKNEDDIMKMNLLIRRAGLKGTHADAPARVLLPPRRDKNDA
jgi:hypothetical protein